MRKRKSSNDINYLSNPLLKKAGVEIDFTEEQITQYVKCKKDPVYFANNFMKVVSLDKGLVNMQLYDYQKKLIKTFDKNRFTIVKFPRQSGKCVIGDSMITIKHKETGEIKKVEIGEFYNSIG